VHGVPMAPGSTQAALLRQEVGELRRRETRRVFDLMVYVGALGGPKDCFVVRAQDIPMLDAALRTEVVSSLVEDCPTATAAWITRSGRPEPYDSDLTWLSAATRAFGMHDRVLDSFHAITRYGWRDVRSGDSRSWQRLRL